MRISHFFLAFLVLGGAVLGAAAFGLPVIPLSLAPAPPGPALPPPPALPAAPAARADDTATATLDRALAAREDAAEWLEAEVWQRVRLPGYAYEADGYYLKAPDGRYRLQMRTHADDHPGGLLLVCDGGEPFQAVRVGAGPWQSDSPRHQDEKPAVAEGLAALVGKKKKAEPPPAAASAPSGVAPLLRRLRERMVWARQEVTRHEGAEVIVLVGVWPADVAESQAPAGAPWPDCTPRQCRLTLDAQTLWPRRVEWGGPVTPGGGDVLLAEMEFRHPVFNRPLPADRCAREFAVPADVVGLTP
jgi:hypothetical protein